MNINISGKNITVSGYLRRVVEKKAGKLIAYALTPERKNLLNDKNIASL